MPTMPTVHRPLGAATPAELARVDRDRRGTPDEQGYTHEWRRARRRFLNSHPLCVMCARRGRIVPANVVDHIIPHHRDPVLFWDVANWQALCAPCHNGPKRRQENAERRVQGICGGDAAPRKSVTRVAPGRYVKRGRGAESGTTRRPVARPSALIFAREIEHGGVAK